MGFFRDIICTGVIRSLSKIYSPEFVGKLTGNADTSTKLTTSGGSSTKPVYFSDGKPVACSANLAVVLSGTLSANKTTATVTNSIISTNSLIDVYTNNKDIFVSNMSVTNNTLTMTFAKSSTADVGLKIVVINP